MKRLINLFLSLLLISTVVTSQVGYAHHIDEPSYETRSRHVKNIDGGGHINLGSYYKRGGISATTGQPGIYNGPRGTYIVRDRAVNSGAGTHGGSYWKLYNRNNQRIGTYNKDGYYLRP